MRTSLALLCLSTLSVLMSCSQPSSSQANEGIDANNRFELLDYKGAATLDEILAVPKVKLDFVPWADTYWPMTEKGVAKRWDVVSPNNEKDPVVWPSDYFRTHAEFAFSSLFVSPMVSPSEKYDMIFRWRHQRDLSWDQLRGVVEPLRVVEDKIRATSDLTERKALVTDLHRQFTSRSGNFFQNYFPMTSDGWSNWLYYTGQSKFKYLAEEGSGEDWRWMGYCHGWAPAALMAETPKHAVLVRFGWQEVLFTEGDIRALLTKSWADHWPQKDYFVLGRRCNKNIENTDGEIPHGVSGKGLYGTLRMAADQPDRNFYVKAEYFASFLGANERIYPLSFEQETGTEGFLHERYNPVERRFNYAFAPTLAVLQRYVETGNAEAIAFPASAEIFGCWDVNPATFHMTLVQKMGIEKQSFTIDRTRTGQVWNQPVYEAKFTFGEPVLAAGAADAAAMYRAPGTKYLVQVKAEVKWTSEPTKPRMVFEPGFDKRYLITTRYEYTLEFDRAKRLIGGEWGTLETLNPQQKAPDFIFGFKTGAKPEDDIAKGFDYTGLIEKIHACSLTPYTDGETMVMDQRIAFTRCTVDRL